MKKKPASKQSKSGKKPAPKPPVSRYPTSWYLMHTGECPLEAVKETFGAECPDVEIWKELGVVELTYEDKSFIDIQKVPCEFEDDDAANAFLQEHGIQTLYWVTVEPVCDEAGLARLTAAAKALGGMICADTDNFEPMLK